MNIDKRLKSLAIGNISEDSVGKQAWYYLKEIKSLIKEVALEVIGEDEEVGEYLAVGQYGFFRGRNKLRLIQKRKLKEILGEEGQLYKVAVNIGEEEDINKYLKEMKIYLTIKAKEILK